MVCVAVVVASPLVRAALLGFGVSWPIVYAATPLRLDALMIGAWLASVSRAPGALRLVASSARPVALASILVLLAVVLSMGHPPTSVDAVEQIVSFTAVATLSGALVVHALTARAESLGGRFWRAGLLTRAGRLSYGLYLIHVPLAEVSERLGWVPMHTRAIGGSRLLVQSVYWLVIGGLTWALAEASWRWLERPILRTGGRRTATDAVPLARVA
jgi:peptidoglycan/LPS O-acetylase OafA/YrhL